MSQTDMPESSNRWGGFIELQSQQLIQTAILGVVLGIVLWLATFLVKQVVVVPLFCGDPTNGLCVAQTDVAGGVATILVAIVGVLGLVRLSVYRPLLVVVATAVSLWGLSTWVGGLLWFEALAWSAVLYALCYVAFTWLVRPRAFIPAFIIVVVAVVLARWLPTLF